MQISRETAAYLNTLIAFTGEVNAKNEPVRRDSVPAQFQRNRNSLTNKLLARIEVGVGATDLKEGTPLAELEWLPYSAEFKVEEGKRIWSERWTDGELELTSGEKEFAKFCVRGRDELPVVSDDVLNQFDDLLK